MEECDKKSVDLVMGECTLPFRVEIEAERYNSAFKCYKSFPRKYYRGFIYPLSRANSTRGGLRIKYRRLDGVVVADEEGNWRARQWELIIIVWVGKRIYF